MDQQQQPFKHPDSKPHIIKWIVIGSLGTMGIFVLFFAVLIYMFTPLIKVDEKTGSVRLFGGAVDVEARDVISKLSKEGAFIFGEMDGVEKLSSDVNLIEIKFSSGEIRIDYNNGDEINWDCDGAGKTFSYAAEQSTARLDFTGAFVDCDISLPPRSLKMVGGKGEVEVRKIQAPLEIRLSSGDVLLDPMEDRSYKYNLTVEEEGQVAEAFTSSLDESALVIKVDVKNGNIQPLE